MMDAVNSTTFIKRPPCITDKQRNVLYMKELLTNRIFLGCYQERRYVNVIKDYRDVVVISNEETDLHNDLDKVRKKWLGATDVKWVGITGPDVIGTLKAYCLWVKFSNLPFGSYWFQIKHVKSGDDEISLQLKCIRKSFISKTLSSHAEYEKQPNDRNYDRAETSFARNEFIWEVNPKAAIASLQNKCAETIQILRPYVTWQNFLLCVRVSCAVLVALVMGFFSFVASLGEFILKLIRELTLLVHAISPVAIQLIDFFTKIVGGLYILLARVIGGQGHVPAEPYPGNNFRSIPYSHLTRGFSQTGPANWRERNKMLRQELLSNSKIT